MKYLAALTLLITGCVYQHRIIEGVEVQELGYTAAMLMDTGSFMSGLSVSELEVNDDIVEFVTKRGVHGTAKLVEMKAIAGFDGKATLVPVVKFSLGKRGTPTEMFLVHAETIYEAIIGRDYLAGTCVYVD